MRRLAISAGFYQEVMLGRGRRINRSSYAKPSVLDDSRFQGLENRHVYVRSHIQSRAGVAGTKRVKGPLGKMREGGAKPCCTLKGHHVRGFLFSYQ